MGAFRADAGGLGEGGAMADESTLERNKRLYDSHAPVAGNEREQRQSRESGQAFPLKRFHNEIKAKLLACFAQGADSLLDLCCGRGGDIHKWIDCKIRRVGGVDNSMKEIVEAMRRFAKAKQSRGASLEANFQHTDFLGQKLVDLGPAYDVVTCMFAIHYFFESEVVVKTFFQNVSKHLKLGGHFIATFPSGKQVLQTLNRKEAYRSPMLYLRKHWRGQDPASPFGQAFECAITDTVTRADGEPGGGADIVGSHEYLVFFNVIQALAKEAGLEVVKHYPARAGRGDTSSLFQDSDADSGFKRFKAPFGRNEGDTEVAKSLRVASELYVAAVFRKQEAKEEGKGEKEKEEKEGEGDEAEEPERKRARTQSHI